VKYLFHPDHGPLFERRGLRLVSCTSITGKTIELSYDHHGWFIATLREPTKEEVSQRLAEQADLAMIYQLVLGKAKAYPYEYKDNYRGEGWAL
jgi:hypothetical protein